MMEFLCRECTEIVFLYSLLTTSKYMGFPLPEPQTFIHESFNCKRFLHVTKFGVWGEAYPPNLGLYHRRHFQKGGAFKKLPPLIPVTIPLAKA